MLPNTREIAMQIAVLHELYPDETISQLANRLMLSPVFIINALDEGEKMELYARIKEEDKLVSANPIDYVGMMGLEFGTENTRLQNEIVRVIASANNDEMDVEDGTLNLWLVGIKPAETEIALHVLHKIGFISSYELANPLDLKSKYKFYTLRINEGKDWGIKQFTSEKKKKNKKSK